MDAANFDEDLSYALDDDAGAAYSAAARASAVRRALAEHAIYRPRRGSVSVALVAGEGDYPLPAGFLRPEAESLARALGGPGSVRKRGGFYDGAWIVSRAYSGTGGGYRQGFASSLPYGVPGASSGLVGVGATIDFRTDDEGAPFIRISPAPAGAAVLAFDGLFPPTVASCPETDREPLLALARACCLESKARKLGAAGKWSEADSSEDGTGAAKSLMDQAEAARELYKSLVRSIPMAVSG